MRKSPLQIVVSEEERRALLHIERSPSAPNGEAQRARMVLLFAGGEPIAQISDRLGTQRQVVRDWLRRFAEKRMEGLSDKPRPGGKPVFSPRGRSPRSQDSLRASR